jgi:hypothetical protein
MEEERKEGRKEGRNEGRKEIVTLNCNWGQRCKHIQDRGPWCVIKDWELSWAASLQVCKAPIPPCWRLGGSPETLAPKEADREGRAR